MTTPLKINTFNGSFPSLSRQLKDNGIAFSERHQFSSAAPQVVMELLSSSPPFACLAYVFAKWLEAKHGRELEITHKDGKTIKLKHGSDKDVELILKAQFNENTAIINTIGSQEQDDEQ